MRMRRRKTSADVPLRDFSIVVAITLLSLLLVFFLPVSAHARPLLLPSENVHEKLVRLPGGSPSRSPPPPPRVSPPISPARSGFPSLSDSPYSATKRPPPPAPRVSPPSHQAVNPNGEIVMVSDEHRPAKSPPPPPKVSPPSHPISSDAFQRPPPSSSHPYYYYS